MSDRYDEQVFINCPFDADYRALMEALVFAVHDCGFVARSALEFDDGAQVRIEKIASLITNCKLGIHDISRTELDPDSNLPRFNMPLELGLFIGAKRFGSQKQRRKVCLILDREPYRYQAFCSDIAGQDIKSHGGDPETAVGVVRDWLRAATRGSGTIIPGAASMRERYRLFREALPEMCRVLQLDPEELIFNDFTTVATGWLKENPW